MTKKHRNWLIALSILAIPFVLFLGCLVFMGEPVPPPAPLPSPNGYDDLVKAGEMLSDLGGDYDKMNQEELKKAVSSNAAAVSLSRSGLSNQCRVPIQYSESYISNHLDDLACLNRLARAFVAEGRLAGMQNRPVDAAKSYLDTIHLGNQMMHGGLLIDEMLGVADVSLGERQLQSVVTNLDALACRRAAASLETLDSQRQTWNELMQQENAWSHGTFGTFPGWRYDIIEWKGNINRWRERKIIKSIITTTEENFNNQAQKTRRLMLDLAARAYELDKGHPPASAADLVPDYLKAVPQDPVTGTNMVHLR